ncbi:hypothetical protein JGS22_024765 [Streptomyces sp. P38-E01]|uniref:Uncharacterized protein n=1 Tax=Streptomyces tardus TaxID=2780544 RepID=A0A949JJS0_9ACTN|nr:hypothetical protein [Streptomyces tardus]MBU7600747.1 hypothetical protein [Streptomyces tardus]
MATLVTVFPPDSEGRRRVMCAGEDLGRAGSLYEVMDLLNGAGLNAAATAFEDTDIFDWRGGGPYAWVPAPPPGPGGTSEAG